MTIRSLRLFVTVAELKNMSKAAETLFITQSSISQAISDIEDEYNVALFDRLKSGIQLTAIGEGMYKYAKKMLNLYDEIENILKNNSANPYIRIGASSIIGSTLMKDFVSKLLGKNSEIDYSVFINDTHTIEEKLLNNELDIGLVEGDIKSKDLTCETFLKDKTVLICSLKHRFYKETKVSLKDLVDERFVLLEDESENNNKFIKALEEIKIEPYVSWVCNSSDIVKSTVKENLGISLISYRLVEDEIKNGSLWCCDLSDFDLSRYFKLIYHKDKFFTKTMSEFKKIIKEYSEE